jgi:hypothetical protein
MHVLASARVFSVEQPQRSPAMSKRELIDTGTDKRYVRRDTKGRFKESVDISRARSADARHNAK